jgi:peptidoglycan/LPS O-acetylase OafA/YrhL
MNQRIKWIDGLKGLASVLIFLHHFILAFYPAMYYGSSVPSHLFGIEYLLTDSPLMSFFGGHFLVCVFLMLSGIVLSIQSKKIVTIKQLFTTIIKRYLKLSIPLFIVSMVVFFMLKANLFYNLETAKITLSPWLELFYTELPNLSKVIITSFYEVWIFGDSTFSNAFWMLYILFYGSLLTSITRYLINKNVLNRYLIYSILIVYFIYTKDLLLNFVFGMIIADLIQDYKIKENTSVSYVFLIVGAILGGFPFGIIPTHFYRYFLLLPDYFSSENFIHTLGALFVIIGISSISKLQIQFNRKLIQTVGKYSYIFYLIHIPILFSFSTFFTVVLWTYRIDYNLIQFLNLIFTFSLIILVSKFLDAFFRNIIKIYN